MKTKMKSLILTGAAVLASSCFDAAKKEPPRQRPEASPITAASASPTPEKRIATFDDALAAYKSKDLDRAEAGFKELAAAEPKNADAHFYLGKIRTDRNDAAGSIGHFREASRLDPKSVEKLMALGDAYFAVKQFDVAIVHYGKVPGFEPENADAYYKMGRTYIALGNKIAVRQQIRKLEQVNKAMADKLSKELGE
jgi:predicted Zn-dependent protease